MNRARERANEFNIIGVDFRLTQGVVKRIIPAVASSNAIIAGSCVLEALKLASNIGCPVDNYLNFSNIDGAFFGPVKLERKENCIVCSKSAIKIETSRSSLLKTFMDMLIEKYQLKEPSIRTAEHFIYIVNSLFPEAEKISKKNLEKSLEVSSKNVTSDKRKEQSYNSDSVRTSSSWRKATTSDLLTSGRGYEENFKQKNCKTKSSTLSLHIAAYENSIEAKNKSNVDKNSSIIENPFEFPRQQEGAYRARPEVSNYRASQRLLDPTGASSSSGVVVVRNNQHVARFKDRRISRIKRLKLIKMIHDGYKLTTAAKQLGISRSGAQYIIARVNETQLLQNRKTAKRIFNDHLRMAFIEAQLRSKRRIHTKDLLAVLEENGFGGLTKRQLRYRITALGFQWRKMKRVQVISKQNQLKRLEARSYWESEGYPFHRYLFSDECTVLLGRQQEYCWVRKGERVPCQGRVRHGQGFHIFAGISWYGATEIMIWSSKHRMKSPFYCANNIKEIVMSAKSLFPGGLFELVQDNHPAHVSYDTLEFLKNHQISTFAWCPQSPDWNAIEAVWRDLKQFIADKEHPPTSLKELKEMIMEFWETKVTPEYCRTVIRNAINNIKKSHDGLNHEKDTATDLLYQH